MQYNLTVVSNLRAYKFPMALVEDQAYVTVATNDTYCLGALVLAHSLRHVNTNRKLVVMITPAVSPQMRSNLVSIFDVIEEVSILDSEDKENLALLTRADLGVTFTKLHCWRLTQFSKGIFMDADILVVQNCDELFDREELSAVPDIGWPDCFNSGVFVFQPSRETYKSLLQFALEKGSFDGGDQGLLNMYFHSWRDSDISHHLSFIYNMNANASYTYLPAYRKFGKDVKVVHFLGPIKPWMQYFNTVTGQVELQGDYVHSKEYLQKWWHIMIKDVKPSLQSECAGLAGEIARMSLVTSASVPSPVETSSEARQYAWERGHMDYMGADSFENIQRKLEAAINGSK